MGKDIVCMAVDVWTGRDRAGDPTNLCNSQGGR